MVLYLFQYSIMFNVMILQRLMYVSHYKIMGQGLEKEKYTYVIEILQLFYLLKLLDTPSGTNGCIWLR